MSSAPSLAGPGEGAADDGALERLWQSFCSLCFSLFILPGGPVVFWGSFIWLATSRLVVVRSAVLAYGVWMMFFDVRQLAGERSSGAVRGWRLWRALSAYFPVTLEATAPLDPEGRYVLGYHPHGVVSLGAFVGVGTDGAGLGRAFPGLRFHLCTLAVNFKMPFIRELILRLGIIPASKQAIRACLAPKSRAVAIAVGGAKEALLSTPGAPYELYLKKRKGFVREALLAKAQLVPVFAFGELDVFHAPKYGSLARRWCLRLQNVGLSTYGYSLPLFCGRVPSVRSPFAGFLQPLPTAVRIVVGAPIPHDGVDGPATPERVDAMHAAYVAALSDLFAKHAHYANGRALVLR